MKSSNTIWRIRSKELPLGERTLIMGVVNVTVDSFSGDGVTDVEAAVAQGLQMVADGADILDIGGESSRPGATEVPIEAEEQRVVAVIKGLRLQTEVPISVDTRKAEVAEAALVAGADIVNDITGFTDPAMIEVAVKHGAGAVVMHMQGEPQTMQANPQYEDVVQEVGEFLHHQSQALVTAGLPREAIMVDPGIGFGKTLEHNLELLRNINVLAELTKLPVLIGTSRKSFIGKLTGAKEPDHRVWGTAASVALAIAGGAAVVRVHDVAAMRQVVAVADAISRINA